MDLLQVLHGCRQSVLWEVRLTPLTDEIPVVNLYLAIDDTDRVSFGAKTSRYGPYELGYRRATKTFTKWNEFVPLKFLWLFAIITNFLVKSKVNKYIIILFFKIGK